MQCLWPAVLVSRSFLADARFANSRTLEAMRIRVIC
jgi:hypothetical protein